MNTVSDGIITIPFPSTLYIDHDLGPLLKQIGAFKSRRAYYHSTLYRQNSEKVGKIEAGIEWENLYTHEQRSENLKVAVWNIERGISLDGIIHFLKTDPRLSQADLLLLNEVDIGMGRSGNRNVPREVAQSLNMNYVYANSFLVLTKGDEGEQQYPLENTLSLHGTAILSRYPILAAWTPLLHFINDSFQTYEKRLGRRRGLICQLRVGNALIDIASVHLDPKSSPRQRAYQMRSVLQVMHQSTADAQLIGGDLNTHTFNLRNKLTTMTSFTYKALFNGFEGTIHHYMRPELFFERPLFELFRKYGFDFESVNDVNAGTLIYDVSDETLNIKLKQYAPGFLRRMLERRLSPWQGKVPMRMDWLAVKNLKSIDINLKKSNQPGVISLPVGQQRRLSDHYPIMANLLLLVEPATQAV